MAEMPMSLSPVNCAAEPPCTDCARCVACACLCVGLARPHVATWFAPRASDLPPWASAPLARFGAAPERKPPRV